MPALWAYARDLFQTPGFGDTVDFAQIKEHYYVVHTDINPTQIVPVGPEPSGWVTPHGRECLGGRPFGEGTPPAPGPDGARGDPAHTPLRCPSPGPASPGCRRPRPTPRPSSVLLREFALPDVRTRARAPNSRGGCGGGRAGQCSMRERSRTAPRSALVAI